MTASSATGHSEPAASSAFTENPTSTAVSNAIARALSRAGWTGGRVTGRVASTVIRASPVSPTVSVPPAFSICSGRSPRFSSPAVRAPSSETRSHTAAPSVNVSMRQTVAVDLRTMSVTASLSTAARSAPAGPSGSAWLTRTSTATPAAVSMALAVVISGARDMAR
ncbi:hypothetical protein ACWGH8_37275 [Nonomuraea muscovyensis]